MKLLQCLLVLAAIFALTFAKDFTVKVKGQVICHKRSLQDAKVELREYDLLDPDDLLATTKTSSDGKFEVSGMESEITTITPYIRVYHHCDVTEKNCYRMSDYLIPEKAIDNIGFFDMNYVNLNIQGWGEKKVCE